MKIGISGIALIKEFEGLRLEAYKCPAGVWTIGYGTTRNIKEGMRITEFGAEYLLREDLNWVEDTILLSVKVPLTQTQYDALCSFIYNVGGGAFRASTMLRLLNNGDYEGAKGQFARWNKSDGKVLAGLVRRREAEAELFATEAPLPLEKPKGLLGALLGLLRAILAKRGA